MSQIPQTELLISIMFPVNDYQILAFQVLSDGWFNCIKLFVSTSYIKFNFQHC